MFIKVPSAHQSNFYRSRISSRSSANRALRYKGDQASCLRCVIGGHCQHWCYRILHRYCLRTGRGQTVAVSCCVGNDRGAQAEGGRCIVGYSRTEDIGCCRNTQINRAQHAIGFDTYIGRNSQHRCRGISHGDCLCTGRGQTVAVSCCVGNDRGAQAEGGRCIVGYSRTEDIGCCRNTQINRAQHAIGFDAHIARNSQHRCRGISHGDCLCTGRDVAVGIRRRPVHRGITQPEQGRRIAGYRHIKDIGRSCSTDRHRGQDTGCLSRHIRWQRQRRRCCIHNRHSLRPGCGQTIVVGCRIGHRRRAQRERCRGIVADGHWIEEIAGESNAQINCAQHAVGFDAHVGRNSQQWRRSILNRHKHCIAGSITRTIGGPHRHSCHTQIVGW